MKALLGKGFQPAKIVKGIPYNSIPNSALPDNTSRDVKVILGKDSQPFQIATDRKASMYFTTQNNLTREVKALLGNDSQLLKIATKIKASKYFAHQNNPTRYAKAILGKDSPLINIAKGIPYNRIPNSALLSIRGYKPLVLFPEIYYRLP
ncbi:hypothetical protein [uncultured Nostoc sp.]|uniref:hypothetical protein n=1 Tax=uncultured Nostoc sp. TaxID=340711 RepID=UPI0035CC8FC4